MLRKLLSFIAGWLVFAGLAGWALLPWVPDSALKWMLLIVVGPPAYLLLTLIGDALGEGFNHLPGIRQGNASVERRTQGRGFSFLRIGWYLLTGLFGIALFVGGIWVVRTYL